ncbi:MAG TPA: NifB/NifX family molybdenum-iron cluster-binding protein [Desulfotignum sp.]|nr:NifB/NifX family molybdenum-iron cluster-binding protein [Desulfotignum sp.]
MKLAVTVWGNRISPVFDSAHTLLIAELTDKKISGQYYTELDPGAPVDLIRTLKKNKVNLLVCGAISKTAADLITDQQIHLISFVTGNVRQFLDSFALNCTVGKKHMMPGFNHRCLNAY